MKNLFNFMLIIVLTGLLFIPVISAEEMRGEPGHKGMRQRSERDSSDYSYNKREMNEKRMRNIDKRKEIFQEKMREREEEVLNYCKENQTDLHAFFSNIKNKDEKFYRKSMFMFGRKIGHLSRTNDFNSNTKDLLEQDIALEAQVLPKVYEYNNSEDESVKASLESEIKSLLSQQFEIRHKLFEYKVQKESERLENLKNDISERMSNKGELIEKRFEILSTDPKFDTERKIKRFERW